MSEPITIDNTIITNIVWARLKAHFGNPPPAVATRLKDTLGIIIHETLHVLVEDYGLGHIDHGD